MAAAHTPASPATGFVPKTLNQAFASAFRRHRKEDAFCYKRDAAWMKVSHDDFAECVREARAGFLECGVTRGDRVGLLSENRLEWTITDMALLSCGAVDVPIYATLTGPQAAFILNDAGAEVVCVSTRKQLEKLLAVVGDLPCVKTIVTFDEVSGVAAPAGVRVIDFAELRRRGRAAGGAGGDFLADMERTAEPDDLATLIYTSGTTGNPKGVMLTHRNLTSNLLAGIDRLPCRPEDVALSYLPLAHVYERTVMNVFIYSGVTVYFAESVDLVAKNLQEVHPTVMTSVPRVFEKILNKIEEEGEKAGGLKTTIFRWAMDVGREYVKLKNAGRDVPPFLALQYEAAWALALSKIRERVAPRIQFFSSGGAALPDKVAYSFAALGMPILQGYGLTETSPVIAANSAAENRYGTVGRPLRDVEVRIAEDGEILVRGPNVMRGYYNQPDKTDEVLKDGWFHTGDIGELDAAGYLRITDRKKDLFKTSGGKYVAPQPIENRLTTSPHIVQAVVIGNGRKFPAALIVPREESLKAFAAQKGVTYGGYAELLKNPQVIDFIQKEVDRLTPDLAQYEKIKKVALLEKELTLETGELTPTLKVKRRVVDEKFQATIDALYEEKSARAAGGGE